MELDQTSQGMLFMMALEIADALEERLEKTEITQEIKDVMRWERDADCMGLHNCRETGCLEERQNVDVCGCTHKPEIHWQHVGNATDPYEPKQITKNVFHKLEVKHGD